MRRIACFLICCCFAPFTGADDVVRTWTTADGGTIQAQFIREVDGDVTFLKDGKLVIVALEHLSEQNQKVIRELEENKKIDPTIPPAGAPREEPPILAASADSTPSSGSRPSLVTTKAVPETRVWRDTRGKQTTGKYVRIYDGNVVVSRGSRVVSLPLAELSPEDQKYLRDLLTARGETSLLNSLPADNSEPLAVGGLVQRAPPLAEPQTVEPQAVEPDSPELEGAAQPGSLFDQLQNRPPRGSSTSTASVPQRTPQPQAPPPPTPRPPPQVTANSPPVGATAESPGNREAQRWRGLRTSFSPSSGRRTSSEAAERRVSLTPLFIGAPIGAVVGSLIGAVLLRAAASWVLGQEVAFGDAFLTMLVAGIINGLIGFAAGFIYGATTGTAEGVQIVSLILVPICFLIQAGVISGKLGTDFGSACAVTFTMYVIIFIIAAIGGGAMFLLMRSTA